MTKSLEIKFKKETTLNIDDVDFDDLVTNYYGHDFEFVPNHEANNDGAYKFEIKKDQTTIDQEKMDLFRFNGSGSYMTQLILQDWVNADKIPEGTFVINVSF